MGEYRKVCFSVHEPSFQDPARPNHLNDTVVEHCELLSDSNAQRFESLWNSEKETLFLFWKREIAHTGESFDSWLSKQWSKELQKYLVPSL
jgi:hypothetical protein